MRKYDLISALSAETSKEVARNEESWKKYLNTASRLYKYPFKDQLLIYAQRPDATACASIEIWNEKMHCWVNKGAKGIALIDEEGSPYTGLRYVFDISDVHKARRIGRFPQLWEMKEEHQEAVLDRLEGIYGETSKEAGFTDRIREIAARIAQDCYGELASDMEYLKEGSFLEELDELNVAVRVRETLADSIAYMVLKRCGMDDAELAEEIGARLVVLHVARPGGKMLEYESAPEALEYLLQVSVSHGADMVVIRSDDVVGTLEAQAKEQRARMLVAGRAENYTGHDVLDDLMERLPGIEIRIR